MALVEGLADCSCSLVTFVLKPPNSLSARRIWSREIEYMITVLLDVLGLEGQYYTSGFLSGHLWFLGPTVPLFRNILCHWLFHLTNGKTSDFTKNVGWSHKSLSVGWLHINNQSNWVKIGGTEGGVITQINWRAHYIVQYKKVNW